MKTIVSVLLALAIAQPIVGQVASSQSKAGQTMEFMIPSKTYPQGRHAWVYTPYGYPPSCNAECSLIIAFDGSFYLGAMPLPDILDSLMAAKRTQPAVAVMVDNGAPPGR